jgi:hypothetical protein
MALAMVWNGAFSMIFILPQDISFDELASRLKQEN